MVEPVVGNESESSDLPTFDELEASDLFTPDYVSS